MSAYQDDASFQSAEPNVKQRLLSENQLKRQSNASYKSITEKMDFDHTLQKVGSEHWYQKRAFLIFALQWFVAANVLLIGSFLFPTDPTFTNCGALDKKECAKWVCTLPENQWQSHLDYSTGSDHWSAAQEFNLICSNSILNTIIQTAPFIGSFLGFLLFPMIADNKGRQIAWILSWGTCTFGCILMSLSFNYYMILIGYFLAGFGANPAITLHYSFLNEHSTGKLREYTSIGVQVAFGIGEIFMVIQVYFIDNWRMQCIIMLAIPSIILNIGPFFVHESPKFLYEKSTTHAIKCLNKIAKVNKKELIKYNALESMVKAKEDKTYSIIDLFKYKSIRMQTICACIIFFVIQAVYYGISFSMGQVGLSIYLNTLIISIAELLAYATTDLFIPKLQRKKTVMIGLILGFCLSLPYIWISGENESGSIDAKEIAQIGLAALFRFNIAFVWTVVYVYLSELFPTTVRSLALGFTSLSGTIGSVGAPFLNDLCGKNFPLMLALGIISLLGFSAVIPLKETLGQPLIQQIKELETDKQDELVIEYQEEEEDEIDEEKQIPEQA